MYYNQQNTFSTEFVTFGAYDFLRYQELCYVNPTHQNCKDSSLSLL